MTSVRELPVALLFKDGHSSPSGKPPGRLRRLSRPAKIVLALLVVLLVLALVLVVLAVSAQRHLAGNVKRIDGVFKGLDHRPARPSGGPAEKALNILVMGTDRRGKKPTTGTDATRREWVPGAQRTDTIMVLHVNGDRDGASLISIPRDSWVDVPGYGYNKVNAAFSFEGPSLAIETIEELTNVRIDHLAVVDWSGFKSLIDVVGGVTVTVPRTVTDTHNHVTWLQGQQELDGEQALLYVRQRYGLPMGDLDRVRRQQAVMRGLLHESVDTLTSPHPMDIYDFLDTATSHVTVDSGWSFGEMRDLVLDLRGLSPANVDYLTVPVRGLGREGDQSVVYLDRAGNQALWGSVLEDRVSRWVQANPGAAVTGPVP